MDWKLSLISMLEVWQKDFLDSKPVFQEESSKLSRLIEDVEEPVNVMVIGEFKAGKSTFINAFLGEEILFSDVIPATAVITKIKYGPTKKLTGYFPDGTSRVFDEGSLATLSAERGAGARYPTPTVLFGISTTFRKT